MGLRDARHDGRLPGLSYLINEAVAKARYGNADHMDFEQPLTVLVG